MSGSLAGVRIIEIAGMGPAPFAGMMLADHGAEVICVRRPGARVDHRDILARSRRSIIVDMKESAGADIVRDLCRTADGLVEGFRPGVMERLGLGPTDLLGINPRLVYGRMTGWGQDGPYAQKAGHDINYIAIAGVLHALGRKGEKPTPPINLLGDFGGGGMLLAFGMVSAILSARTTGTGQVVDCAMTDGAALLMSMTWSFVADGRWQDERGVNTLDTGAHFYETYETADHGYLAIGAIEPPFYEAMREATGLADDPLFDRQRDSAAWPELKDRLAAVIRTRTRDEWVELMRDYDACCAPVLSMHEAPLDVHNLARQTFLDIDRVIHPAPAPRYSGTPSPRPVPASSGDQDTDAILAELGYDEARIAALRAGNVLAPAQQRSRNSN